jgi:hypothetical protein
MKLNDKQKSIIVDLIDNEIKKYKTHGLKIDQEYKLKLETIREKLVGKPINSEKALYEDMCKHSEKEDW